MNRPPLHKRPIDLCFVLCFLGFATTSFCFDTQVVFDITPRPDGPLLVRINHWFSSQAAPVLASPPVMMKAMIGISAFIYGPIYLLLAFAFWTQRNWIRIPALMFAATVIYSFVPIMAQAIWGQPGPKHWPMFLGAYLPYLVVPIALIIRMRHPEPFAKH